MVILTLMSDISKRYIFNNITKSGFGLKDERFLKTGKRKPCTEQGGLIF